LDLTGYIFPLPVIFCGCTFKGEVRIEGARFESWVNFSDATFEKSLIIKNTEFEGEFDFESGRCHKSLIINDCQFKYKAKFDDLDVSDRFYISKIKFEDDVDLSELGAYGGFILSDCVFDKEVMFSGQFHKEALFLGNRFDGFVYFSLAHFKAPIILRGNVFKYRPTIDKIRLSYLPVMPGDKIGAGPPLIFGYYRLLTRLKAINDAAANLVAQLVAVAKAEDSYPALRQFRLFAQEYDDRRLALEIYALEQKSRRLWYDHPLSSAFILGLLFQIFSDFGRSIFRPLVGLLIATILSTVAFFLTSNSETCSIAAKLKFSVLVSANNALPFLAWPKQSLLARAEACLFSVQDLPLSYGILSISQMMLSLVFLFLTGLAIRNAFKMQS
jgi:hypothetical protein